MKNIIIPLTMSVIFVLVLAGCASVPSPHAGGSDERAIQVLHQAAIAHGSAKLLQIHDVNVRLEGQFTWIVSKVQPTLVDKQFRGTSEEQYLTHEPVVTQRHMGLGGTKHVRRDGQNIDVSFNGQKSRDPDVRDAAAMVADNYRMFLFGPAFFFERSAVVQYVGAETVDHFECDNLLAELKPGIGNSDEDRVVISIDRDQHIIRRVRITLRGMESTRSAIADIYLRDPIRIGGMIWPTTFDEELQRPFVAPVHHWRLVAIDYDRSGPPASAPANPTADVSR